MTTEQLVLALKGSDDTGRSVICVALLATYYFDKGTQPHVRQAVGAVAARYCAIFGAHLRWAKIDGAGFTPVVPEQEPWRTWQLPIADTASGRWEFYLHAGEQADAASDCRVFALGNHPKLPGWSFLSMAIPLNWYVDHDGSFAKWVAECCEQLNPVYAYAGIGLTESPRLGVAQQHEAEVFGLARRFPGLELDYPTTHASALKGGVRSPSWLTFVDGDKLTRLGGLEALRNDCGDDIEVQSCGIGALLRAGRFPPLGDDNRQLRVPLMERLARILKPLQVATHPAFHFSKGGMNHDKTQQWLRRFDTPSE